MEPVIHKYADKLVRAGLAERRGVLIGIRDAEVAWNREDGASVVLEKVMAGIDKRAILFTHPAEPYKTIIDYLA